MQKNSLEQLAKKLNKTCNKYKIWISSAESCTGGFLSYQITSIPGSSTYFTAGLTTYSNFSKISLLNVSEATLKNFGAVSEEVAGEMALGVRNKTGSDFSVSVTGIAGPGGSDFKPEGLVCFGLSTKKSCITKHINYGPIGREKVRINACREAISSLIDLIIDEEN